MSAEATEAADRRYWNAELETMAPAELRRLEQRLLLEQLAYAAAASDLYRAKWAGAGVDPGRVRSIDDLTALPFTEKSDLQESQAARRPFGTNQAAPADRLVRMQATGGTSGRPLRMAMTRADVAAYNEVGARAAWAAGLRPGDILFECMNYSLYAGGVNDHGTFETLGACVAPVGVGQSKRLLEILADLGAEAALYSTPSYALHLAGVAIAEGRRPRELGLRRGLFSGDAGLANPAYRAEIEDAFGLVARNIYGTGETAPVAAECDAVDGLHWLGQGTFLAEFVEPESGDPVEPRDGATAELVITTLRREAHPLIRFRTHDYVRLLADACSCGRTGPRFTVLGRSDDMLIVRGINVFPAGRGRRHRRVPARGDRRVPDRPRRAAAARRAASTAGGNRRRGRAGAIGRPGRSPGRSNPRDPDGLVRRRAGRTRNPPAWRAEDTPGDPHVAGRVVTAEAPLLIERSGRVVVLRLNRPAKLNALSPALVGALVDAVEQAGADSSVGALLLTSAGRAFSAGGDLTAMLAMDGPAFRAYIEQLQALSLTMQRLPIPTVAALRGHVLAGGFELAIECDIRIAADDATFGLPDTTIGLSPTSGMSWRLPRIVGEGWARHLLLTGETIDVATAERIGLVTRVVPGADLEAAALALAESIASQPPEGLRQIRAGLDRAASGTLEDALATRARSRGRLLRDPRIPGQPAGLRRPSRSLGVGGRVCGWNIHASCVVSRVCRRAVCPSWRSCSLSSPVAARRRLDRRSVPRMPHRARRPPLHRARRPPLHRRRQRWLSRTRLARRAPPARSCGSGGRQTCSSRATRVPSATRATSPSTPSARRRPRRRPIRRARRGWAAGGRSEASRKAAS